MSNMKNLTSLLLVVLASCVVVGSRAEGFKPQRVHFVDHVGHNAFFRGNEPLSNDTRTFLYDDLIAEIKNKAAVEGGFDIDRKIFLVDISFEYVERKDISAEKEFFEKNPHLGMYVEWPLFGAPVPPYDLPRDVVQYLAKGPVWFVDDLPKRLADLRGWLEKKPDDPEATMIVYAHCEAGCDRTGEFIASYLMQYKGMTIQEAWDRDTSDCGRDPVHFSEFAIDWYCEYLFLQGFKNLGKCVAQR